MQQNSMVKGQMACVQAGETAAGWNWAAGTARLFLRILPGGVLAALESLPLSRRCSWLLRAVNSWRQRIPEAGHALPNGKRGAQETAEETPAVSVGQKVLIFEQDIGELRRYAEPFEVRGVEVHKCTSIEAAMRSIEREEFDLALIDQMSPAFESRRVIRHLVRYNWPVPFLVLVQPKDALCFREALELGAAEYLEKPVSEEKMDRIARLFLATPGGDA